MKFQTVILKAHGILKRTGGVIHQNSPAIFAGLAIAGVVGTTIMSIRAVRKAQEIVYEATYVDPDTNEEVYPETKEVIAMTWKCYIPVVLSASLTIGSIVAGHTISARRNAILAGLLTTSQQALEEYQKKTEEVVGHAKSEKIRDGIAEDILEKHPIDRTTVVETGYGHSLCFDVWSGRYFWSDYSRVQSAVADFNLRLIHEYKLCLNEFYEMLGLDSAECGEEVGFNTDLPLILKEPKSKLASDGTPCLVISYTPSATFRDW